ncbi:sulfotransferase family protein [Novosphingobium malaysiense]|uniref:Sulfotransferase family protein n=1 Tax=Novosphingobium malaysiense TaxID=1348853 RepID=A0A0B1ZKQ7_9SPHN|nr:sulfotransferase family protein [Novosphingobium malaysiense]KHK91675.1 hypothetical protein LK12_12870 [Novosphingobium malaysiense]
MALKIIGAGLGRTGTMSLKLALEHLGFGPCYHMSELLASARRNLPLWLDVVAGKPDWDTIFDGYCSTTDYPACNYWRELADHFPEAKIILTTRDPDSWFNSVSETIFSPDHLASFQAEPVGTFIRGTVTRDFADRIHDRTFMTDFFARRNEEIIATIPAERLLVLPVGAGWEPLCNFLGVEVPKGPYPRVNTEKEWLATVPHDPDHHPTPDEAERFGKRFISAMRDQAFGNRDQPSG